MYLKEEAQKEKAHASMMEGYSLLLMELICRSEGQILVVGVENGQVLYCNTKDANEDPKTNEIFKLCLEMTKKAGDVDCRASLTKRILQESRRKVNPFLKKIKKIFEILKKVKIQGKWRE